MRFNIRFDQERSEWEVWVADGNRTVTSHGKSLRNALTALKDDDLANQIRDAIRLLDDPK